MRGAAVIIAVLLSGPAAIAQQDAFSLRLGPEIGGGLGHRWGNAIDFGNGLVSGGLMFEGRLANAWGWAVRPAYARSVAYGGDIATAFGEDRVQLLTGPVWRADNGRTMRAYARTAPFIRLMGGAVNSVSVNTSDILPMAELGLGLKFRLNDRNDIELALAAQGAGTSQHNLQLAGMLSLAYHINFKERKIKFRSPPLNLVPRTTEADAAPASKWESPFLPSRKVEFPPAEPQQAEAAADVPSGDAATQKVQGGAEDAVVATDTVVRQETVGTTPGAGVMDSVNVPMEEGRPDVPSFSEKKEAADPATQQEAMRPASQDRPAPASVQEKTAQPQTAAPAQQEPVRVTVQSAPAQQVMPIAVPVPTGGDEATARALRELAEQQGQMMAMLRELMADRNQAQSQPIPPVQPGPGQAQPPHAGVQATAAVTPAAAGGSAEEEQLRGEVTRLSLEMASLAERFAALESRLSQQGAATPSPRREGAPRTPLSKTEEAQPPGPVVSSESPTWHEVQFAKNSYGLNAEQSAILSDMARQVMTDPSLTVVVEGFADRSGPAEFNAIIARKRASEVLSELKRLGVPVSRTVFASYGDERSSEDPSYRKVVVRLMR